MCSGKVFGFGGRSLMHIMKGNCSNTDPCRNSMFYCSQLQKKILVSLHDFISSCFLLVTYDLNQFASSLECHRNIIQLCSFHEVHSQKHWQLPLISSNSVFTYHYILHIQNFITKLVILDEHTSSSGTCILN
jgi:hypothetical protein